MAEIKYCEQCDDEASFHYCGNGDWQCEKGHFMPPEDAFQDFRNEGTNGVGPFRVYLLGEPSSVLGFIHVHDRSGIHLDTCEVVEDGMTYWISSMFIPWARINSVRVIGEAEEKRYREKVHRATESK